MVETLDSLKYKGYGEGLLPLMRELEFDRLISRLGITENATGNVVPEYTSATADDIAPLASEASGKNRFALAGGGWLLYPLRRQTIAYISLLRRHARAAARQRSCNIGPRF